MSKCADFAVYSGRCVEIVQGGIAVATPDSGNECLGPYRLRSIFLAALCVLIGGSAIATVHAQESESTSGNLREPEGPLSAMEQREFDQSERESLFKDEGEFEVPLQNCPVISRTGSIGYDTRWKNLVGRAWKVPEKAGISRTASRSRFAKCR